MAQNESNLDRLRSEGQSAFVLGYTGEIGKVLVQELSRLSVFKRVVLVGRRQVDLDVGPEFEQKQVDYENLEASKDVFQGLDVGFCCLGTTKGKAGTKGFVRVDHDYVLMSAEIAKAAGCKHFSLVSSQGANVNSSMLYPKTKGQVEEDLKALSFDRLSIYRPGLLLARRQESRPGEAFFRCLMAPFACCCPRVATTPVKVVAMAMINDAALVKGGNVTVYENKGVHQMSGISDRSCCCC